MIRNQARLNRKLKELPLAAKTKIRTAIAKSADEITSAARRLAPVDTGALRDSIDWTWDAPPKGTIVLGRASGGVDLTATIFAGNDKAYYARWVEFGTANLSAQPFFYPSYRSKKKAAKSRIKRAVNAAAREVANS
jgi:HK97 gp10 family phage protein